MNLLKVIFAKREKYSIGIEPSKKTKILLDKQNVETKMLFLSLLEKSGRYNNDKIFALLKKHDDAPFKAITDGEIIFLERKKEIGLNVRKKYGKNYLETLTDAGIKDDASTDFFKNSYNQAYGIISRKFKVEELKRSGIKKCRISSSHDERDCALSKDFTNKVFNLEDVPELPLDGCDASYCRCVITPCLDE